MQRSQRSTAVLLSLGCLVVGACGDDIDARPSRVALVGAFPAPIAKHGEKWQDPENASTRGQGWREPLLYVDGVPRAAFRAAEFPIDIVTTMSQERRDLDFNAGDPGPRTATYYAPRWNIASYLERVGVPVAKVTGVVFHAGRGSTFVSGDDLRRHRREFFFDLTDEGKGFLRIYRPRDFAVNTTYDRYVAMSVFVAKPAPTVDAQDEVVLDGVPIVGVPYYGQPLRGGIRVYVDDKIATVLKRNLLGSARGERPSLAQTLGTFGVDTQGVKAVDLIVGTARTARLTGEQFRAAWFASSEQASGTILLNGETPATALMLYTKRSVSQLPALDALTGRGLQRDTLAP
ncbi:MAG: hypothetical protein IPL79_02990 [Myxococcales bacterium]|nr:hypothetical protein [Myxococcales bacterium]